MVRNFSSNKERIFYSVCLTNSDQSMILLIAWMRHKERKHHNLVVFPFIGYVKISYRTWDLLAVGLADENNSFIFISVHTA